VQRIIIAGDRAEDKIAVPNASASPLFTAASRPVAQLLPVVAFAIAVLNTFA
jgi:hypothetical protein